MAEDRIPSVNDEPANLAIPPAHGRGETVTYSLPDLARLTLGEQGDAAGCRSSGLAPPVPDSQVPAATHIHVTVHAHQGSSIVIHAAPGGVNATQGRGRLVFPNAGRHALAAAPVSVAMPAATGPPVPAAAVPVPDVATAPVDPAAGLPAPDAQNSPPHHGNVGGGDDPDEDIYPQDPAYRGKWYAVIAGRRVGIFPGWLICGPYVTNVPGNLHKSFGTRAEAYMYYLNKKIDGEVFVVPP